MFAIDPSFWFADTDGDGFGNEDYMVQVCGQPNGYVNNDEDCDDRDSDVTPNTVDYCNGKLDDCSNTAEVIYDEIEYDMYHWTNGITMVINMSNVTSM